MSSTTPAPAGGIQVARFVRLDRLLAPQLVTAPPASVLQNLRADGTPGPAFRMIEGEPLFDEDPEPVSHFILPGKLLYRVGQIYFSDDDIRDTPNLPVVLDEHGNQIAHGVYFVVSFDEELNVGVDASGRVACKAITACLDYEYRPFSHTTHKRGGVQYAGVEVLDFSRIENQTPLGVCETWAEFYWNFYNDAEATEFSGDFGSLY